MTGNQQKKFLNLRENPARKRKAKPMANFTFTEKAMEQYIYWQTQDRKTLKRINGLIADISRNGAVQGIGKPELLRHDKSGLYSRRIDEVNPSYMILTQKIISKLSPAEVIMKIKRKGLLQSR